MSTKLAADGIYFDSEGHATCCKCTGYTGRETGRDIHGGWLARARVSDARLWEQELDTSLACECGRVTCLPVNLDFAYDWPKVAVKPDADHCGHDACHQRRNCVYADA